MKKKRKTRKIKKKLPIVKFKDLVSSGSIEAPHNEPMKFTVRLWRGSQFSFEIKNDKQLQKFKEMFFNDQKRMVTVQIT